MATMHGDPEWSLTDEQFQYLQAYASAITAAFDADAMEWLHAFAAGDSFLDKFGDMGFDEAWDRYEDIVDPQ